MSQPALQALPVLQPGVSVELLRRTWHATPENRRHQRASLLDSIVRVKHDGVAYAKPLRDLTLAEVEAVLGAVTPRYVVRWYDPKRRGTQATTFINQADALSFAGTRRLHGEPARVTELGR